MGSPKPVFQSVIDLGLRDVGVSNQPRRLAAHFGKSSLLLAVLWAASVVAMCAVLSQTGANTLIIAAFAVAWTAVLLALALRMTKRSPVVVMRVTADGGTKTVLWLIAPYLLLGVPAVVIAGPLGIPVLVLGLFVAGFVWRRREHLPEVLRELRPLLGDDELVLGDGIGLIPGMRGGYDAFRLVVATDRRLIVAASTRSKGPFFLVDVAYRGVDRFDVDWPYRGRLGKLSLTVAAAEGEPPATHVISQMAPANLVSIARALRLNGVDTDDLESVTEAEQGWEDAKRAAKPKEPRRLIWISGVLVTLILMLVTIASAAGFDPATLRMVVDEAFANQQPVDGRSNLTGNDASLTYTPGPDLKEFIVDEDWDAGPNDGARWELRSPFTKGYNVVSLSHYIFDDPYLDNPRAVRDFVAGKDREHSRIADKKVTHTERVVDGRTGYVWTHGNRRDYWHYVVWFPQPVHTIRVECIAKKQESRFKRLCSEAVESLEFH